MIVNNYYQINEIKNNLLNNSKKALNQVLTKNSFTTNIINDLERELEYRFQIFVNNKASAINSKKFDDPENSLKYIMLKQIIKILDDLFYERMINLSGSDKALIQSILNNSYNGGNNCNYMGNSLKGQNRRNNSVGGNIRRNIYGNNQITSHYQMNPYNVNYQNRQFYPYANQESSNYRIEYNKFY